MHVVWPERAPFDGERTGLVCNPDFPGNLADLPSDIPLCKWEERFTICEMQAILHMLEHLTRGLPGAVRRMLLRRADQFPKLHGHFALFHGRLGFHAEEGEAFGPGECWMVGENGEREQLW